MDLEQRMKLLVHEYKQMKPKITPKDFIIRIADGKNFWNSDRYSIWGIGDQGAKTIMKSCEKGDRLWFCTSNSGGQLVAVSTFEKIIPRFKGLDKYDMITNEEFGWTGEGWECNNLIKYKNRYNLELDEIYSGIKGACPSRCIDNKKTFCPTMINLNEIYKNIIEQ